MPLSGSNRNTPESGSNQNIRVRIPSSAYLYPFSWLQDYKDGCNQKKYQRELKAGVWIRIRIDLGQTVGKNPKTPKPQNPTYIKTQLFLLLNLI